MDLEMQLSSRAGVGRRLIGSFSAASNVTGLLERVDTVTETLHRHGALAFWDYAAAGPHVKVCMNPTVPGVKKTMVAKDAIFMSPHKMHGGPGTPGILLVKKRLLANEVPSVPGGGTVFYVTSDGHRYLENIEEREEGGTPDVLGVIRCGLVFQLKAALPCTSVARHEAAITQRVLKAWDKIGNLRLLGDTTAPRLPIVSFMITWGEVRPFSAQYHGPCGHRPPLPLFFLLLWHVNRAFIRISSPHSFFLCPIS